MSEYPKEDVMEFFKACIATITRGTEPTRHRFDGVDFLSYYNPSAYPYLDVVRLYKIKGSQMLVEFIGKGKDNIRNISIKYLCNANFDWVTYIIELPNGTEKEGNFQRSEL